MQNTSKSSMFYIKNALYFKRYLIKMLCKLLLLVSRPGFMSLNNTSILILYYSGMEASLHKSVQKDDWEALMGEHTEKPNQPIYYKAQEKKQKQ